MTLKEFLNITYISKDDYFRMNKDIQKFDSLYFYRYPRIYCKDGFNISVQGGHGLYSTPDKKSKIYENLEIGFPKMNDDFYEDEIMNGNTDVRGYVSIQEIQDCFDRHGGIDEDKTFENISTKRIGFSEFFFRKNHPYIRRKKIEKITGLKFY